MLPEREAKAAHAIPDVPDLKEAVSRHLSTADKAGRLDIRVRVALHYITANSYEGCQLQLASFRTLIVETSATL